MNTTFDIKVVENDIILRLIPILDMAIAEEFLSSLRECASMMKNLILDSQDVERLSTPCIQVMLATASEMEQQGLKFSVRNISEGFQRGICDLGLIEYLDNWSES
ncbi:STAS domain-containing protein [Terasakiella sp.]|uniref:STAS domain-containing protein n=1 Tax=Terasakiella sp. TaxID=2034861 RepID=UPI003AA895A6